MRPQGINDLQIMWAIRDIHSSIVSCIEKAILWALVATIGNRSSCKKSHDQIALSLGIANSTLRKYLLKLEEKKFIQVTSRQGCRGEYFLNYTLLMQYAPTSPRDGDLSKNTSPRDGDVKGEPRRETATTSPRDGAHRENQRENLKDREKEQPSLSSFEPTEEHKIYASDFRINLDKELNSFKEYYRGQTLTNLDFSFKRWLEKAKTFAQDNPAPTQSRMYVEWGKGHPDWERLHAGKK